MTKLTNTILYLKASEAELRYDAQAKHLELTSELPRPCFRLLRAGLWEVTYLHITLHKRIPHPRGFNQRTDICRCLAALAEHVSGLCGVGVVILICSKVRDSEVHVREARSRAQGWGHWEALASAKTTGASHRTLLNRHWPPRKAITDHSPG